MDNVFTVSEFVVLINQTLEFAYPVITVEGEVSEFRISKNRWVYFKLKDEESSVQMFGTVYMLQQPIEDGMKVRVKGQPRLHNKYGFSLNIQTLTPSGEGDIKKAFELLKKKLLSEGLFDESRKRQLPPFPTRVGLISSTQAAGYRDFLKILQARWQGMQILVANVQVQGEAAPAQITEAITYLNQLPEPVEVIVLVRGGGGLEDLMAFNSESVVRAIAASRAPTLVGVGHEVDITLADLSADVRAATPTDAARLLVPDRVEVARNISAQREFMSQTMSSQLSNYRHRLSSMTRTLSYAVSRPLRRVGEQAERLYIKCVQLVTDYIHRTKTLQRLLISYNPHRVLQSGYSITRIANEVLRSIGQVSVGDGLVIELVDGLIDAEVKGVKQQTKQ